MLSFQIKTVQNPQRTIQKVENNKLHCQVSSTDQHFVPYFDVGDIVSGKVDPRTLQSHEKGEGVGLGWVGLGWDLLVVGESDGVSGRSNQHDMLKLRYSLRSKILTKEPGTEGVRYPPMRVSIHTVERIAVSTDTCTPRN